MNRHERRQMDKLLQKRAAERPCGDCTACCTCLQIPSLDKAMGVTCQYVGLGTPNNPRPQQVGCTIYASRPKECRAFVCMWKGTAGLLSFVREEDRPDKSGVVMGTANEGTGAMTIYPAWPGAFNEPQAVAFIERLIKNDMELLLVEGENEKRRLIARPGHPALERGRAIVEESFDS